MKLYKFRSGRRIALTKDRTGGNLPPTRPPWVYMSPVEVKANDPPRIGASSADILAVVEKHGYAIITVIIHITATAIPRRAKHK